VWLRRPGEFYRDLDQNPMTSRLARSTATGSRLVARAKQFMPKPFEVGAISSSSPI
jgi:hypothetical protein